MGADARLSLITGEQGLHGTGSLDVGLLEAGGKLTIAA